MSEIKVQCIDQALNFLNTPVISSGNVNYDTISFDFCSRWDDHAKTAIFYRNEDEVYYQLLDENDSCLIPNEVLREKGVIYIGVFGTLGDKTITSQVLTYRIQEGAITENLKPADPTPAIYDQILSYFNDFTLELANQDAKLEDLLAQFTGAVGNAKTLGGHNSEYFATAQSVENLENSVADSLEAIENGTTEVAKAKDANTVGGKHVSDFLARCYETKESIDLLATAEDATICPKYHATRFRALNATNAPFESGDFFIEVQKIDSSWIKIIATTVRGNYEYSNVKASGVWKGWKCGAFADEVLSLAGGTLMGNLLMNDTYSQSSDVARLSLYDGNFAIRVTNESGNYSDFTLKATSGPTYAGYLNGGYFNYTLLHTGNSQKVTITADKNTPPSTMEGLWAY